MTLINVEIFKNLLISHSNQAFVKSVVKGLKEGFWLFANIHLDIYPSIYDMSTDPLEDLAESDFLRMQKDIKIAKHCFSPSFSMHLYLSMTSFLIYALSKPNSTDFQLITDLMARTYSLNLMVLYKSISEFLLNNLNYCGKTLLNIREYLFQKLLL